MPVCDVPPAIVQEVIINKGYGWALPQPAPAAGRAFFVFEKQEIYVSDGKKWQKMVCLRLPTQQTQGPNDGKKEKTK